jgi:hypothetical protein
VDFTAAAEDSFFLRAGDATEASLNHGEMRSVAHASESPSAVNAVIGFASLFLGHSQVTLSVVLVGGLMRVTTVGIEKTLYSKEDLNSE